MAHVTNGSNAGTPSVTPDYTVSNTDGSADFSTVAQVNAYESFAAGDIIAFKRGDSWAETLDPPINGTSGNHLVFTDYGSGALPKMRACTLDFTEYIKLENLHFDQEYIGGTAIGMYDAENIIIDSCHAERSDEANVIFIGPSNNITISDTTINGSTVAGHNTHCIYISGETIAGSNNITIEDCDISGGHTCGIQLNPNDSTYPITNVTIQRNKIHGNEIGIGDYGSDGTKIYQNEIYENGGIDLYNDSLTYGRMTDAQVWNNTFYNPAAGWGEIVAFYYAEDIDFRNNIVVDTTSSMSASGVIGASSVIDYNMYNVGSFDYSTWASWQSSGWDANGSQDDPEFNDAANADFTLSTSSPTSPAINAGVDVGLSFNGAAPDLGANETD